MQPIKINQRKQIKDCPQIYYEDKLGGALGFKPHKRFKYDKGAHPGPYRVQGKVVRKYFLLLKTEIQVLLKFVYAENEPGVNCLI